jgi:serine/threonine protein phosphatase 1
MAKIFALADIHGHYDALLEALSVIDLSKPENKLIILGDYVDRGSDSLSVLETVKEYTEKYPEQVIALKGNHDQMLLEWLLTYGAEIDWRAFDNDFTTLYSLLDGSDYYNLWQDGYYGIYKWGESEHELGEDIALYIWSHHKKIFSWLNSLPYYYETPEQIYVHAGIDEEYGNEWAEFTDEHYMTDKFPPTVGKFHKDIIAGHNRTREMFSHDGKKQNDGIFFDGESHYFIDGYVEDTNHINVLVYDTKTKFYTDGYTGEHISSDK